MSFIDEIQSLDTENPGGWPGSVKIASLVFLVVLILFGGYWFFVKDMQASLETLKKKETELKNTYSFKYQKAAQLDAYKEQLEEMQIILQSMLRQLPSKNEMSDLIVDVSQTALASGIENELFEPGAESIKDFYAEKPISLRMKGNYHEFGDFVSGVASLPRVVILTMHDISLKPIGDSIQGGRLLLEGTARTYRYLDDEEMDEQALPAGGAQ
ncbi:type 4a pilus biogenesis protein PilO [Marinicella sp. S1101]|uniref:type 4a pilus biogenesis protein PilO n=1 Tax=Marinicella marina TaxID=2996016 RepID=UPI002260B254|nr:type 4a pilus biogenesis protein PilO [Marinicella marina]MCX7554468.1 type 4a pilus biogenesis protein PilO [Marinicella marina]MDJ1140619.1 type 4a pilus biogenesis protein PilO [Marinicella marina]